MAARLIAFDADDLAVISAHVQEASVAAADIIWRQDEKRLVVGMRRLDWEQTLMYQGFKFRNPNEKQSCGCGHSFSV